MKVRIEFEADNAAFEEDFTGEVTRILTRAAGRMGALRHDPEDSGALLDSNGNLVGFWTIKTRNE